VKRDPIAGLETGYLCPGCQTADEDGEAKVREVLSPPATWRVVPPPAAGSDDDIHRYVTKVVDGLVKIYPSPAIMRDKANQLEAARRDEEARWMVGLMRAAADEMEFGA
jgi:hypothetical protein